MKKKRMYFRTRSLQDDWIRYLTKMADPDIQEITRLDLAESRMRFWRIWFPFALVLLGFFLLYVWGLSAAFPNSDNTISWLLAIGIPTIALGILYPRQ